jgi:hypothetical protein
MHYFKPLYSSTPLWIYNNDLYLQIFQSNKTPIYLTYLHILSYLLCLSTNWNIKLSILIFKFWILEPKISAFVIQDIKLLLGNITNQTSVLAPLFCAIPWSASISRGISTLAFTAIILWHAPGLSSSDWLFTQGKVYHHVVPWSIALEIFVGGMSHPCLHTLVL